MVNPGNQNLVFFSDQLATLVVKNQNLSGHVTHRLPGPTHGNCSANTDIERGIAAAANAKGLRTLIGPRAPLWPLGTLCYTK